MPFRTKDGIIVEHGVPFTLNGVDYGGTWLSKTTAEEKDSVGITWSDPPSPPAYNPTFYTCTTKGEEYEVKPLPLEPIKANMIADSKRIARAMLGDTDWMVIRATEIGVAVEQKITDRRTAIRAEQNRIEAAVEAADFESIQEIEFNWPGQSEE